MSETDTIIGTIHPPKTMFLHMSLGTATDSEGNTYELSTHPSGFPIVRSRKTGKWFTLSWPDILDLADRAGIDAEENSNPENPL